MEIEKSLRRLASTLALLASHARNIHWNIEGAEFFELHGQTEKLYDQADAYVDLVSEKMLQKKLLPPASFAEFLANTSLKDLPSQKWSLVPAGKQVLADIEAVFKEIAAIDGKTNAFVQPLLDEIVTFFDKTRWQFAALIK